MSNFIIVDGNGDQLGGISTSEIEIQRIAQRHANHLGKSVYYTTMEDDGETVEVEPEPTTTTIASYEMTCDDGTVRTAEVQVTSDGRWQIVDADGGDDVFREGAGGEVEALAAAERDVCRTGPVEREDDSPEPTTYTTTLGEVADRLGNEMSDYEGFGRATRVVVHPNGQVLASDRGISVDLEGDGAGVRAAFAAELGLARA